MEKILQILAVFALLMLVAARFIRARDSAFRRFGFLGRLKGGLQGEGNLMEGVFGPSEERKWLGVPDGVDAFLFDEESRLLFCYTVEGRLTIYRQLASGMKRELQELSVPLDCSAMWWNPQGLQLFLEEGGEWFVYGAEEEGA